MSQFTGWSEYTPKERKQRRGSGERPRVAASRPSLNQEREFVQRPTVGILAITRVPLPLAAEVARLLRGS